MAFQTAAAKPMPAASEPTPTPAPKPEVQKPAAKERVQGWGVSRGIKERDPELRGSAPDGFSAQTSSEHHGIVSALAAAVDHHNATVLSDPSTKTWNHTWTVKGKKRESSGTGEFVPEEDSRLEKAQGSLVHVYNKLSKHAEAHGTGKHEEAGQHLVDAVNHLKNAATNIAGERGTVTNAHGESITVKNIKAMADVAVKDYYNKHLTGTNLDPYSDIKLPKPQKATRNEALKAKGLDPESEEEYKPEKGFHKLENRPKPMDPDEGLSPRQRAVGRKALFDEDSRRGAIPASELPNTRVKQKPLDPETRIYHLHRYYLAHATGEVGVHPEALNHISDAEMDAIHKHIKETKQKNPEQFIKNVNNYRKQMTKYEVKNRIR